jgi:putative ABC transport system ATP-binding protein
MISLRNIHKRYKLGEIPIPVLKGISLNISQGEFVAIMGPSGSGKSTLLNIIGCLDVLDEGSYYLAGMPVEVNSEDDLSEIRNQKLGFVFQQFNLIPRINAVRNVELPLLYSEISPQIRKSKAMQMLKMVGLGERAEHSPAQLSGGQQQRVAIARALVNAPTILIADEPTGSLDTQSGNEIMHIFKTLNETGITIVMVTHEEDIAAYASRVIRLRDGVIETDGKKS